MNYKKYLPTIVILLLIALGAGATTWSMLDISLDGILTQDGNGTVTAIKTLAGINSVIGETIASTTSSNTNFVNDAGYITNSVATLSSLTSIGTIGTGVWNGTAIDFSTYTNATGGRSITLNGDAIDADAETYTGKHKIAFEDPTADDDFFFGEVKTTQTFTSIYCKTLVGTVTLDVQIAGVDINGTDIVCDTTGVLDATLGGDTAGAVGEEIKLAITSVATAPTYLFLQLNYEYDD